MRNRDYWKQRQIEDILASERSAVDYEDSMIDIYTVTLSEIKKAIEAFYNKYAKQRKITYAEARRRLDAAEFKDFQAILKQWYSDSKSIGSTSEYRQFLEALSKKKYITRMESLQADIRYQIEKLEAKKVSTINKLLEDNYVASYYLQFYEIARSSEISVKFDTVDAKGVERAVKTKWSQTNYSQTIWRDRDRLVKNLETLIPQSFARGLNSNELGDMLAKEMNTSKNRARALVRTEVNRICNQASLDSYKVSGIEEYEYLATLDMRTSEICRDLDGKRFKVTQAEIGVNYPPMHVNCRSTTVPYFDDEDEFEDDLGRVARDEEGKTIRVPRKMTQEEYINTYVPESFRQSLLSFKNKYYKD